MATVSLSRFRQKRPLPLPIPKIPTAPALTAQPGPDLGPFLSLPLSVDFHRIYRAHVTPQEWRKPERTIFVEAWSERSARERMIQAITALDWCTRNDAAERLYNLRSARELIETGHSTDPLQRLFETG